MSNHFERTNKMKEIKFNLHFTDFCNFHCWHCFVSKVGRELSLENIKIIGNKLARYGNENNKKIAINLAGGEPFYSTKLQAIIDHYHKLGIKLSIITNGFLIDENFIKNNASKLDMIGISVDSLNYETNLKIGRCNQLGAGLNTDRLINTCNLIKKYNIKLKINICISSINLFEDLSTFIELVKPDRLKILRVLSEDNFTYNISDAKWQSVYDKYAKFNPIFEDNPYMKTHYLIIDSLGNLTRDNLHNIDNSIIDNRVESCIEKLDTII